MANPNWKKGVSGNPKGRPRFKYSVRTPKGVIERVDKKYFTEKQTIALLKQCSPEFQLEYNLRAKNYLISKMPTQVEMSIDNLPDNHLTTLHTMVIEDAKAMMLQNIPILIPETIKANDNEQDTADN